MWLINVETYELKEFFDSDIPRYAILSHTWEKEEVTFQDMQALSTGNDRISKREGFLKIRYTCEQAVRDDLRYAWVDTCCIDKSSSAELSEAINSMYRWYARSAKCYVYLSDIAEDHPEIPPDREWEMVRDGGVYRGWVNRERDKVELKTIMNGPFAKSRWFTRGWTLQELIAPKDLRFYGSVWNYLGAKECMPALISTIARIDRHVLEDSSDGKSSLESICIAQKMTWAARRQTSRVEDRAYCLLGLFGINMPLLYGEGKAAFVRLQEELMRTSDDQTIFAWSHCEEESEGDHLLAPSPSNFLGAGNILRWPKPRESAPYTMTNRGLHIRLPVISQNQPASEYSPDQYFLAILACHYENNIRGSLALPLVLRQDDTFDVSVATGTDRVRLVDHETEQQATVRDLYIRIQPVGPVFHDKIMGAYCFKLHQDERDTPPFRVTEFFPSQYWDETNGHTHIYSNLDFSLIRRFAVKLMDKSGQAIFVVFHWKFADRREKADWVQMLEIKGDLDHNEACIQAYDAVFQRNAKRSSRGRYGDPSTSEIPINRWETMVATIGSVHVNGIEVATVDVTLRNRHPRYIKRRVLGYLSQHLVEVRGRIRLRKHRSDINQPFMQSGPTNWRVLVNL